MWGCHCQSGWFQPPENTNDPGVTAFFSFVLISAAVPAIAGCEAAEVSQLRVREDACVRPAVNPAARAEFEPVLMRPGGSYR